MHNKTQNKSGKVQYIGTEIVLQYILVTINRTTKKVKGFFLLNFPHKRQRNVIKTHVNKVYW